MQGRLRRHSGLWCGQRWRAWRNRARTMKAAKSTSRKINGSENEITGYALYNISHLSVSRNRSRAHLKQDCFSCCSTACTSEAATTRRKQAASGVVSEMPASGPVPQKRQFGDSSDSDRRWGRIEPKLHRCLIAALVNSNSRSLQITCAAFLPGAIETPGPG